MSPIDRLEVVCLGLKRKVAAPGTQIVRYSIGAV
jgi:hypothetical protein